jgi:hypothetical protein
MIRRSWMLVSFLAATIVILAGPDQPEQAIDTERSFPSRFMSEKRACCPRPLCLDSHGHLSGVHELARSRSRSAQLAGETPIARCLS